MSKKHHNQSDPFTNLPKGIPFAYRYRDQLWKVRILKEVNGQLPEIGKETYHTVKGGSEALYQADELRPGFPAILVDEELDAVIIQQEAKNIISAVATGGMTTARKEPWRTLLASASSVLICFPDTAEGHEATQWWVEHLPHAKVWRWDARYKNVNDMAKQGTSITKWIEAGLRS